MEGSKFENGSNSNFRWVEEGYLKVEWDSQRGIYVGRLVKEPPRRRRRW